jgi:predicted Holliday junction resolvase-like endonuclease
MRQIPQAGTSIPMSHFRQISAEKDVAINELSQSLATTEKALAELKSQQQSKSVRLGQISEHSVGLLPNFPFDIKEMRFLGSPIDYMAFDFDKEIIYFVEVKTGKSKLSERQKTIKRIVEAGNVKFTQIKITETGIEYEDDGNNIM